MTRAWSASTLVAVGVLLALVLVVIALLGGSRGRDPSAVGDSAGWIEVTAMKTRSTETDLDRAWFRIGNLEGVRADDATWAAMQELAIDAIGGSPDDIETDRRAGSVQATSGTTLVDVIQHGQAMHVYYTPGTADDDFRQMVELLHDRGYTLGQGSLHGEPSEWIEVPPEWTPADIAAYQDGEAG